MYHAHYLVYLERTYDLSVTEVSGERIVSGKLSLRNGLGDPVDIVNGIPRFVSEDNYAGNFGLQWNTFKSTQLDSASGLSLTASRFWSGTKWAPEELSGKVILEVGSGAGRFTEILLGAGAKVVSFDYSNAVDANFKNNAQKGDVFIFQGDLYDIPLADGSFDFVFCYGVLQHTPDPVEAYKAIFRKLRPGGKISIDYYLRLDRPSPWSTPKYFWRPISSRLDPNVLLKIVRAYIPLYLPVDSFIRRIPRIGESLAGIIPIPCWNYLELGLSDKQRTEWAIMDTFDALGAKYDDPKTLREVADMIQSSENGSVEVFYGSNGVVANVTKSS